MKKINDSLTEEELIVLRDKGTERAFSGKFDSFLKMELTNAKTVVKNYLNLKQNIMLVVVGQAFLKLLMRMQ